MTVQWILPQGQNADWWGPGVKINIASSFNPAPNGPFTIELKWTFGPGETPWFNLQPAPIDVPAYAYQVLYLANGSPQTLAAPYTVPVGASTTLEATFRDKDGVQLDKGTLTRPWNPTANEHADILQMLNQTVATGGFTATDRAEAETTQMAVQANFPRQIGTIGDLVVGLGDLVEHIGTQLVVPDSEILISGRGSLERPSGPIAINAYGLTWRFAHLLPGLGYRDGAVATFYDRILQLVRVDVDRASNEYLGEVFDIRTEGGRIVWGFGIPRRLLFDVLPGCVVGVRWLLL